jgi:hypothetical protein
MQEKTTYELLTTSNASQDLHPVLEKIKKLQSLAKQMAPYFDDILKNNCQVANCEGRYVVLIVANASLATHLRFQTALLLSQFKKNPHLQMIQEIRIKIVPSRQANKNGRQRTQAMKRLSPQTASTLRQMAASLQDERLRKIMERIASYTQTDPATI